MAGWVVLRDTAEHEGHGWVFDRRTRGCEGTRDANLFTGDYTIEGWESRLIVERKGSVLEYAHNLVEDRWYDVLGRLSGFDFAHVVLEFSLDDLAKFPFTSAVPFSVRRKLKTRGNFLLRAHIESELRYPRVRWHFASTSGKAYVASVFKRAWEGTLAA